MGREGWGEPAATIASQRAWIHITVATDICHQLIMHACHHFQVDNYLGKRRQTHEQRHDEVKRWGRSSHHRSDRHSPHPHSTQHVRGLSCTWLPFGTRFTCSITRRTAGDLDSNFTACAQKPLILLFRCVLLCHQQDAPVEMGSCVRECAGAVQDARRRC